MEDLPLTQDQLSAIFEAIQKREMAALAKQNAELSALLAASISSLHYRPSQADLSKKLDKKTTS